MVDSAGTRRRQPPIADFGFLSDCHCAALVSRDGSIDWWCVPRFDSPSVLGRLLDPEAGFWAIRPAEDFQSERHYVGNSLVLRRVEGRSGTVDMCSELVPRPEYGRTVPYLRTVSSGVEARGGPVRLVLTGSISPRCADGGVRPSSRVSHSR